VSYRWHTLVAGHVGRLGTRGGAAELQIVYVADLQAGARATLQNVNPALFFKKYRDNAWAISNGMPRGSIGVGGPPVTKRYLGKLAAADVFTRVSAFAVLGSLGVDGGVLGPFGYDP
jgi:hypothetical protein